MDFWINENLFLKLRKFSIPSLQVDMDSWTYSAVQVQRSRAFRFTLTHVYILTGFIEI